MSMLVGACQTPKDPVPRTPVAPATAPVGATAGAPPARSPSPESLAVAPVDTLTGPIGADWTPRSTTTVGGLAIAFSAPATSHPFIQHTSYWLEIRSPGAEDLTFDLSVHDGDLEAFGRDVEPGIVVLRRAPDWMILWHPDVQGAPHGRGRDLVHVFHTRTVAGRVITCSAGGWDDDTGHAQIRLAMAVCATLRDGGGTVFDY
jgi:hypothetical protein